jgi:hypothetical protein
MECAILYKRVDHPWIFGFCRGSWNQIFTDTKELLYCVFSHTYIPVVEFKLDTEKY